MSSCRLITLSEEQVESKSWKAINDVLKSEKETDNIFNTMLEPSFMEDYGENWTITGVEPTVTEKGIQKLDGEFVKFKDLPASSVDGLKNKLFEFIESRGISPIIVDSIENTFGANPTAAVNFLDMTLELLHGKISEKDLAEEAAHVYTKWIKEVKPSLYSSMAKEAVKYEEYAETKRDYQYETEEEFVFEAIGKIIGNRIINKKNNSNIFLNTWWGNVKKWLKEYLDISSEVYKDMFDLGVSDILNNKKVATIKDKTGKFFSLGFSWTKQIEKLLDTDAKLEKKIQKNEEGDLREKYFHATLNRFVNKRITEEVKKKLNINTKFTDEERKLNDKKAVFGTKAHAAAENIIKRYIAKTKNETLPDRYTGIDTVIYDKLEAYLYQLLALPEFKGATILSEIQIFSEKIDTAGTLDLVFLDTQGFAHILDFKFVSNTEFTPNKRKEWNLQLDGYRNVLKEEYGIKKFGMLRMLPFKVEYDKSADVKSVSINSKKLFDNVVVADKEITNVEGLDEIISKLEKDYTILKNNSRIPFTEKADKLLTILNTINNIKVKKDITGFKRYLSNALNNIEKDLNEGNITYERAKEMYHLAEYYSDIHYKLDMIQDLEALANKAGALKIKFRQYLLNWAESNNLISKDSKEGFRKVEGGLYQVTNLGSINNPVFGFLNKLLNEAENNKVKSVNKFIEEIENLNITEDDLVENKNNKYSLISQFKGEFYKEIKDADTKWIKENTRIKEIITIHGIKYNAKEHFLEELKRKTEYFKSVSPEDVDFKIDSWRKFNDFWSEDYKNIALSRYTGNNIYLEPTDKWHTEKYSKLISDKNSGNFKFYEAVQDLLNTAKQYTSGEQINSKLLPFVEQSMITKLFSNGIDVRLALKHFKDSVIIRPEDTDDGRRNLNIRYLSQLPANRQSTDLKRIFTLFADSVYDVKYKTDIEAQSHLGKILLENSRYIVTDNFGNAQMEESGDLKISNEESAVAPTVQTYTDFQDFLLYGIKNKKDLTLSTGDGKQLSGAAILNKGLQYNAVLRIAFKPLSIMANLFGGNANLAMEAAKNRFFSLGDLGIGKRLLYTRNKEAIALLHYFDTFTENNVYRKAQRLSMSTLEKIGNTQAFMIGQEFTEKEVQNTITLAYLNSHTVKDGKIVKKEKGDKSIIDLVEFKNKELVLPEIDEKSYNKVRMIVQDITLKTTGSKNDNNRMLYQANVGWRAIAQFKSFVLPLGKERFGTLSYNSNADIYEEGRYAQMFKILLNKSTVGETLKGLFSFNLEAAGIGVEKALRNRYDLLIKLNPNFNPDNNPETGLEFEEYEKIFQQNVRAMVMEVALYTSLLGLGLSQGGMDDDKDKKILARTLDRFKNELSYFYNVTSVLDLGGTSVPLLNTAGDAYKFVKEIAVNMYGIAADEPELVDPKKLRAKAGKVIVGLHQIDNIEKYFNGK